MRMQDLAVPLGTPRRAFPTALGGVSARTCKNAGSDSEPIPADVASNFRRLKRRIVQCAAGWGSILGTRRSRMGGMTLKLRGKDYLNILLFNESGVRKRSISVVCA